MLTEDGDRPAYKKLAAFNSIMLDKSNQTCMDYSYDNMIKDLRNTTWSPEGGDVPAYPVVDVVLIGFVVFYRESSNFSYPSYCFHFVHLTLNGLKNTYLMQ